MANRADLQPRFADAQLLTERQAVHIDSIRRDVFADYSRPQVHRLQRLAGPPAVPACCLPGACVRTPPAPNF